MKIDRGGGRKNLRFEEYGDMVANQEVKEGERQGEGKGEGKGERKELRGRAT